MFVSLVKTLDNNTRLFVELLKAGLWEKDVQFPECKTINIDEVYRLAEEQSVVGLVASGIERVSDIKAPKELVLQFVGSTLQIEQRNLAMNDFVAWLNKRLQDESINAVLVKGQGIAQCYERPLWRCCGDIDLFLDNDNYSKAKELMYSFARVQEKENRYTRHIAFDVNSWTVELHGSLRGGLLKLIDKGIDDVQEDTFRNQKYRVWKNGEADVFLPEINNDLILVFTHILYHFFKGGIGLRQICDWCRLLWTFRSEINSELLERRLKNMRIMTEWKAFAALAVVYLGMTKEAMPLYSEDKQWERKAKRIMVLILESGNFGHNRDNSYYSKYPFFIRKTISFGRRTWDNIRQFFIFPKDSLVVWESIVKTGIKFAVKGE